MANSLSGLIPVIYEGLDIVSREMCGLVRNVSLDSKASTAAKGQTVTSPVTSAATTEDVTPGATPADSGDQTFSTVDIKITEEKVSPIRWTGNEQLSVGSQLNGIMADQFAQSLRALVNDVEVGLYQTAYKGASRAYGTAGATPFGTAGNLTDAAQALKILTDNGAPLTDRKLGLDTSAVASIRGKQSGLFEVNRAGNDDLLRRGVIGDILSFGVSESAGITAVTKGTGTGYLCDLAAGYAKGSTAIHVDTGTGTILAGDIVTFAGDTNKYVVKTGFAGNGDGDIVLADPGLLVALADDVAMTIVGDSTRNLAYSKTAIHLATRGPQMPVVNGKAQDSSVDVMSISDPRSGLVFQVAMYLQYRRVKYEVGLAWGYAAIKPEHICVLLG